MKLNNTHKISGGLFARCFRYAGAALLLAGMVTGAHAQTIPEALAHWNLGSGSSGLVSSTSAGTFTLVSTGSTVDSSSIVYESGYASMNSSTELVCTGINSADYSGLKTASTIMITMRVDALTDTFFTWGLVNVPSEGTSVTGAWGDMSMSQVLGGSGAMLAYMYGSSTEWANSGTSLSTDEWVCVTITLDQGTLSYYLNDTLLTSTSIGTISDFDALAIGRINRDAANGELSLADIQIYDSVLEQSQIAYLSAQNLSNIPEPAVSAALGGILALALVIGVRSRRR